MGLAVAEAAERFAHRAQKQIGVPVEMADERLTSWEAERLLEETQGRAIQETSKHGNRGSARKQGKITVDAIAAAVILKEYLERHGKAVENI